MYGFSNTLKKFNKLSENFEKTLDFQNYRSIMIITRYEGGVNMKMIFDAVKYLKDLIENPEAWYNKIDGKEVEFILDSNLGRCEGYFILKEWCEAINDSDN